jgi:hypothetical protein
MATIRVDYTIPFGTSIRIGYRLRNTSNPFVYINPFPNYSQSPYNIEDLPLGDYEVELTSVCPNCTGANYGDPVIYPAVTL